MPKSFYLASVILIAGCAPFGRAGEDKSTGQTFDSNGVKIWYTSQGKGEPVLLIHGFVANYRALEYARKLLPAIARQKWPLAENTSKALSYEEFQKIQSAQSGLPMGVLCQASVDLVVDGHGKIELSKNPVLEALVGVRADRIRSCKICKRVFWSPRVNSECCSQRCRKTFNQRSSREARRRRRSSKKGRQGSMTPLKYPAKKDMFPDPRRTLVP